MHSWPQDYQHWPTYLPFPTEIPRNKGWVPNATSVNWPMSQFAPLYLPPGSPSFQPYRYGPGGPLTDFRLPYRVAGINGAPNGRPGWAWKKGPAGDLAQLPPSYGGVSMPYARARFNPEAATGMVLADQVVSPLEATGVSPVSADVLDAADPEAAAAVTTSFVPFEPDLLEGLSDRLIARLQRLETFLTKMDAKADLGPRASRLEGVLLGLHDRLRGKLERRMASREKKRGKNPATVYRKLRLMRARRKVKKAEAPTHHRAADRLEAKKAAKIKAIRDHYQAGKITRNRAEYLINATLAGKRPSAAKDLAVEAGGISHVGRAQRAHASGYTKGAVGSRVRSYFGR